MSLGEEHPRPNVGMLRTYASAAAAFSSNPIEGSIVVVGGSYSVVVVVSCPGVLRQPHVRISIANAAINRMYILCLVAYKGFSSKTLMYPTMTKANWVEKAVLNNFFWASIQRKRIVPVWKASLEMPAGAELLEVGCGRGAGSIILFEEFNPNRVDAFDVDEEMVIKAKNLLSEGYEGRIRVEVGDVTKINASEAAYDAVFDFFTLHHVEDWYRGVAEISRVIRPGGYFAYAELYVENVSKNFLLRNILRHPSENRFKREDFVRALAENSLRIMEKRSNIGGYGIIGVARKMG
jgi:ubiquinone/menaquinone biosynthesis C-methylase UbiE